MAISKESSSAGVKRVSCLTLGIQILTIQSGLNLFRHIKNRRETTDATTSVAYFRIFSQRQVREKPTRTKLRMRCRDILSMTWIMITSRIGSGRRWLVIVLTSRMMQMLLTRRLTKLWKKWRQIERTTIWTMKMTK